VLDKMVVAYPELPFRHPPVGTEENYEMLNQGEVTGPRCERIASSSGETRYRCAHLR
jgi:hypothetical protein